MTNAIATLAHEICSEIMYFVKKKHSTAPPPIFSFHYITNTIS